MLTGPAARKRSRRTPAQCGSPSRKPTPAAGPIPAAGCIRATSTLDYRNLRDLERLTFHVQDVTQVLSDVIWAEDTPFVIPDEYAAPLGDAMSAVGDVLRATEEDNPDRQAELARTADAAINELTARLGSGAAHPRRPQRGGIHPLEHAPHAAGGEARPAGRATGGPVRNPVRNLSNRQAQRRRLPPG